MKKRYDISGFTDFKFDYILCLIVQILFVLFSVKKIIKPNNLSWNALLCRVDAWSNVKKKSCYLERRFNYIEVDPIW